MSLTRFHFLLRLLFFVCLATGSLAAERPNIIFILADDLGPGDLSSYGGEIVKTPNIDSIGRDGIRFTQYYSAAPICSPSRAGLLTGQHPGRWRITSFLQTRRGNRGCEQDDFLDPRAPSLPRQLKAAGYATAHIGNGISAAGATCRARRSSPRMATMRV
jgi:arylsulfatase A-like enzyme